MNRQIQSALGHRMRLINPYRFPVAGGSALLLDETGLGSANAAYSVARKLRDAYSGSCIRVRRSSDNAEQDIGFSSDALDESALTTFVGAGNGFITKFYDQSGNGKDAVQATSGNQGRIVASGTVEKDNGKPAMAVVNGSTRYIYSGTTVSESALTALAVVHTGAADGDHSIKVILSVGLNDTAKALILEYGTYNSSGNLRKPATGLANIGNVVSLAANTSQLSLVSITNGTSQKNYEDDATVRTGTWGTAFSLTTDAVYLLAYPSLAFPAYDGYLQEAVVWLADLDSVIADIKSNVNGFYGIY